MGDVVIQFRSVCLSAHLDSFCRKLNELVGLEFVYQSDDPGEMRRRVGWQKGAAYENGPITAESNCRAKQCEVLVEMLRELDLMEWRVSAGKKTIYISERWFKPLVIRGIRFPAIIRLISPRYFRMARRFVRLMDMPCFWVFPCGIHAVNDFVRLYKLLHGDFRCIFRAPLVKIDRHLGGKVEGWPRIRLWGYFVEPSKIQDMARKSRKEDVLRILWCGRMLDWKRVDVLIKAFKAARLKRGMSLLIVGEGPRRKRLEKLAGNMRVDKLEWETGKISFSNYVSNEKIRELMHEADVYVMSSNAEEGWGAAVSDALAESCPVISTFEAGSSATLLPADSLYHSDSVKDLVQRLLDFDGGEISYDAWEWSGDNAACKLLDVVNMCIGDRCVVN